MYEIFEIVGKMLEEKHRGKDIFFVGIVNLDKQKRAKFCAKVFCP